MKLLLVFLGAIVAMAVCSTQCNYNGPCRCSSGGAGVCYEGWCYCTRAVDKRQHLVCHEDSDCIAFGADHCHQNQGAFCHHDHGQSGHDHSHCTCHGGH